MNGVAYERAVTTESRLGKEFAVPATAALMWLLPIFSIPNYVVFRPPIASIFLLILVFFAVTRGRLFSFPRRFSVGPTGWIFIFCVYCIISAAYACVALSSEGKLTLELINSRQEYYRVAIDRLLQIALMLFAFEVTRRSQYPSRKIMYWWLQGLVGAVCIHIVIYATTSDKLVQRAGTFTEGNLAGLYYLLSFFVAIEYGRVAKKRPLRNWIAFLAIIGVLLSRSVAAIVLLTFLLSIQFCISAPGFLKRAERLLILGIFIPLLLSLIVSFELDFGIREKLFEQDLTAQSFSRIDRLESASVAIRLFFEKPLFGHGLQTYGFLSNELLTGPLAAAYNWEFRRIPNNIYVELLCELGLAGFFLFSGFIVALAKFVRKYAGIGRRHWLLGLSGVLLYWNAFPTYSVLFVWVFFGLMMKSASFEFAQKGERVK